MVDWDTSPDQRYGYARYKGVTEKFKQVDDDQWRDYQFNNTDSESFYDFFGGSWELKRMERGYADALQRAKDRYNQANPPAPKAAPKPAPAPTPKVDKVESNYLKQIKDLENEIKKIQASPPKQNVPPPKPPTTPYSVGMTPISLSNPYQKKTMGGIGQFKARSTGMATIKSGLVNI
jgi:hypothetical protein